MTEEDALGVDVFNGTGEFGIRSVGRQAGKGEEKQGEKEDEVACVHHKHQATNS